MDVWRWEIKMAKKAWTYLTSLIIKVDLKTQMNPVSYIKVIYMTLHSTFLDWFLGFSLAENVNNSSKISDPKHTVDRYITKSIFYQILWCSAGWTFEFKIYIRHTVAPCGVHCFSGQTTLRQPGQSSSTLSFERDPVWVQWQKLCSGARGAEWPLKFATGRATWGCFRDLFKIEMEDKCLLMPYRCHYRETFNPGMASKTNLFILEKISHK